ncbi:type II secretion system F family protein [Sedimenticola thiotaurini]|nr:type II secretion system F family protein [Sedimenticola thiotaurini]
MDLTVALPSTLSTNMLLWSSLLLLFVAFFIIAYILVIRGRSFWGEYEAVFKDTASVNMEDMFLFIDPARLFFYNVLALVILPLLALLLTGDIIVTLVVALLVMVVPFYIYKAARKRRLRTFEKQLPDALGIVSSSLTAGASLNIALESLVKEQPAPLSQEFILFLRERRIGLDFDIALRNMERRLPVPDFLMFGAAMRISREVGGNLAETLDTLSDTLRKKAAMEGKIESLTAQGKMQGYVMTGLPLFLGLLLSFLEPEAMSLLFTTAIGWGTVAVIVVMELLGFIFIRKVTNIDI